MPCTNTRAKHNLCAPKTCPDEKCPCAPASAFSCKPCDELCLCDYLPREAFGRIIAEGQTGVSGILGVALDTAVSNQGIDSVEVDPENDNSVVINFRKGLFDRCPTDLPPIVSTLVCGDDQEGSPSLSGLNCASSTTSQVIINTFSEELDGPASFDFRAVQAPRKTCH
jgi:hypothetical protein